MDWVTLRVGFEGTTHGHDLRSAKQFCLAHLDQLFAMGSPEIKLSLHFEQKDFPLVEMKSYFLPTDMEFFTRDLWRDDVEVIVASYENKKDLVKYKMAPSKHSKNLVDIMKEEESIITEDLIDRNRLGALVLEWISNPDPYLQDVTLPFYLYNWSCSLFHLLLYTPRNCKDELLGPSIGKRLFAPEEGWPFEMYASLPRFLLRGELFSMEIQKQYVSEMQRLCEAHPRSVGTFRMGGLQGPPELAFEKRFDNSDFLNVTTKLPGCAWGLFLSREQVALLGGKEAIRKEAPIYQLIPFESGGGMLQLTSDMNSATREQMLTLRKYLSPYTYHGIYRKAVGHFIQEHFQIPISLNELEIVDYALSGQTLLLSINM